MINKNNYKYFLIPFLTAGSSLYQIVYWWRFGLNAFEVLKIDNLIYRSYGILIFSFIVSISLYIIAKRFLYDKIESLLKFEWSIFIVRLWLFIGICSSLYLTFDYTFNLLYFIVPFIILYIIVPTINIDIVIDKNITSDFNRVMIVIIVLNTLSLYPIKALGDFVEITTNKQYKYTIMSNSNALKSDTLKFIGKADETFVFTSLKNDKIHFIKSENLVLYDK